MEQDGFRPSATYQVAGIEKGMTLLVLEGKVAFVAHLVDVQKGLGLVAGLEKIVVPDDASYFGIELEGIHHHFLVDHEAVYDNHFLSSLRHLL